MNVEVLGTETLITFEVGHKQWIAKWNGQWNVDIGERIPLYVTPSDIYMFEVDSGSVYGINLIDLINTLSRRRYYE